jgi:hypothetical protein
MRGAARARNRIDERAIARKQIHILERRRLIEHLVRVELCDGPETGHDALLSDSAKWL